MNRYNEVEAPANGADTLLEQTLILENLISRCRDTASAVEDRLYGPGLQEVAKGATPAARPPRSIQNILDQLYSDVTLLDCALQAIRDRA